MSKIVTGADSKIYMEIQMVRISKVIILKKNRLAGFTQLDMQYRINILVESNRDQKQAHKYTITKINKSKYIYLCVYIYTHTQFMIKMAFIIQQYRKKNLVLNLYYI